MTALPEKWLTGVF